MQLPTIKKTEKPRVERDVPWNVVVLDDPVNLMEYVTRVIQKIFQYEREKAEKMMLEVHEKGKSVVWSGNKEKSELYAQQLQAHQLTTVIEKSN